MPLMLGATIKMTKKGDATGTLSITFAGQQ